MPHPQPTRPVTVVNATGKTGSRVARLLAARGVPVRTLHRRSTPRFDWEEPRTWSAALAGSRAAYVTFPADLAAPHAPATLEAFARAARDVGVEHVVLLSGRGEAGARTCEEVVAASGVPSTVVRASWFTQNFTEGHLLGPVRDGLVALPAGDVAEPFVDVDDIAEVVVTALLEPGHAGRVHELTGPRLLTFHQAADELAALSGRPVRYVPVTAADFLAALTPVLGEREATTLTAVCEEVFDGRNAQVTSGVQDVLRRAPRDFADVCRAAAAAGVWA